MNELNDLAKAYAGMGDVGDIPEAIEPDNYAIDGQPTESVNITDKIAKDLPPIEESKQAVQSAPQQMPIQQPTPIIPNQDADAENMMNFFSNFGKPKQPTTSKQIDQLKTQSIGSRLNERISKKKQLVQEQVDIQSMSKEDIFDVVDHIFEDKEITLYIQSIIKDSIESIIDEMKSDLNEAIKEQVETAIISVLDDIE